jgi:hypothetical protein
MEPAGVDPERAPEPAERSEPHPARAKDDGSSAEDAPEPGLSIESRALPVEPAGVEPVASMMGQDRPIVLQENSL